MTFPLKTKRCLKKTMLGCLLIICSEFCAWAS
jgi:hypothetical protein